MGDVSVTDDLITEVRGAFEITFSHRLVREILPLVDERPEIPANVSEAREQRILNKRWLGF